MLNWTAMSDLGDIASVIAGIGGAAASYFGYAQWSRTRTEEREARDRAVTVTTTALGTDIWRIKVEFDAPNSHDAFVALVEVLDPAGLRLIPHNAPRPEPTSGTALSQVMWRGIQRVQRDYVATECLLAIFDLHGTHGVDRAEIRLTIISKAARQRLVRKALAITPGH